jgi:hypothetical protein
LETFGHPNPPSLSIPDSEVRPHIQPDTWTFHQLVMYIPSIL